MGRPDASTADHLPVLVGQGQLVTLGEALRHVLAPVIQSSQIAFGVGFNLASIYVDHIYLSIGVGGIT
jgi:hypothetical protein